VVWSCRRRFENQSPQSVRVVKGLKESACSEEDVFRVLGVVEEVKRTKKEGVGVDILCWRGCIRKVCCSSHILYWSRIEGLIV